MALSVPPVPVATPFLARLGQPSVPNILAHLLGCSFLWASSFIFIKVIAQDVSPVALTALRGLMGAALIGVWLVALGGDLRPRGREWRDWAVLGFLQGLLPNTLVAYALATLPTGLTAILQSSTPLFVALAAPLVLTSERLTLRVLAGVGIGFAGIVLLVGPSLSGGEGASPLGVAAMALTVLSYALGNLYVPRIPNARPLRLAFGQQAFAGIPAMLVLLTVAGPAPLVPALDHVPALIGLGALATALPIVIYMNLLRVAGPTLGSMYGYLIPVWTVLLAAMILGERIGLREMAGGAVVLVGLALVTLARRRQGTAAIRKAD